MGPVWLFMGHPGPRIAKKAFLRPPPPGHPNMKNKLYFYYFGFELKKFLSDCFLIWYVYWLEDSWKARSAYSDHWSPQDSPSNSQNINFLTLTHIWKTGFQLFSLALIRLLPYLTCKRWAQSDYWSTPTPILRVLILWKSFKKLMHIPVKLTCNTVCLSLSQNR